LERACRGVTVESNMSNPNTKLGTDLTTHFQYTRIPHSLGLLQA
jgi:hypothetical protein